VASRPPERLTRAEAAALLEPSSYYDRPSASGWEGFDEYVDQEWQAGQHVSIFAPTEGGKTHLIRHGLLPHWQRYPVLWLRFKPRDRTLGGWGIPVNEYPDQWARLKYANRRADSPHWHRDPEHFLIRLPAYRWSGDPKRESESWQKARKIAGEALDQAFRDGGWVVVLDEVRAFSDGKEPSLSLSSVLENNWQRGRDQPLTVIAATQQPASAPSSMYDQPRWVFLGRTLDVGRYQRISELGGDTEAIKAALPTLGFQEFLAVDRHEGAMWRVKAPPAARTPVRRR